MRKKFMKILKKIIIWIIFFGLLISNTFAFDTNLEAKTDSFNNIVNLLLQIKSEKWKNRKDNIFKLKRLLKQLEILWLPTNKQLCYDILDSE